MINKKGYSIVAAAVFASTLSTAYAADVYHVTGDMDYADSTSYSREGRVYVRLNQVKFNGANSVGDYSYTTLYYSAYKYGEGYSYWYGRIDNNDVSGDGNGKLTLNTDTCAYAPRYSCGPINLTWTKDGDYVTRSSGVTRTETPYSIRQETGTKTSYSSTVVGTVNGMSLDDAYYNSANQGSAISASLNITDK